MPEQDFCANFDEQDIGFLPGISKDIAELQVSDTEHLATVAQEALETATH